MNDILPSDGYQRSIIESKEDPFLLVDSETIVRKETIEASISERRRLHLKGHKGRFLHLKKYNKIASKTDGFPRIVIQDKVYDTKTGYSYLIKNIITCLVDQSSVFKKLCDAQEASLDKISLKKESAEFYKYFDETDNEEKKILLEDQSEKEEKPI